MSHIMSSHVPSKGGAPHGANAPTPPPPGTSKPAIVVGPLTERQRALFQLISSLNPAYRYTITVTCSGKEPWQVEQIVEHRDIDLRPQDGE